jgi:hypothetical protein
VRPPRLLLACITTALLIADAASPAAAGAGPVQTYQATVRIIVVDDASPAGDATGLHTMAVADVAGRLMSLPAGQTTGLRSGQRVTVTAVTGAGRDSVRSVRAEERAPAESPAPGGPLGGTGFQTGARAATTVLGPHQLTVLPVYWTAPDSATRSTLTALAAATSAYWSAQSGGRIMITPAVRDWARIPDPGSCDPVALANAALAAHAMALPVSTAQHVAIYFPERRDCGGWAGLAQISGSLIWDNGVPLTDVLAHEFGHNLGLGHANLAGCTGSGVRVTLSPACSVQEYRDYADVMGAAMDRPTGNLNTALADSLGLVTSVTVPAGGQATVDLAPLAQVGAIRAIKIRVGTAWLYADFRPAADPDTREPGWAGVQLHLVPDAAYPASRLLDGQPGTTVAFSAVSLPVGRPWAVPGTDLTISVVSASSSGARVTVAPARSDPAPAAPAITAPAARALVSSTATVAWRTAVAVTARVLVDGIVRATPPSLTRTGSAVVTGLTDGPHQLTVEALNSGGTVTGTSAAVPVVADATAPGRAGGLRLTSGETLVWSAPSDSGSGVAGYLIALDDGSPVRAGATTSARVRTPPGRHTWWVAAVDRAGNVSLPSGLVVVRDLRPRAWSPGPGARSPARCPSPDACGPRAAGRTR